MPGTLQTLDVPPNVSPMVLWNAVRIAFVNQHYPGAITYDPLGPAPPVNFETLLWAVRNAAAGQLQS